MIKIVAIDTGNVYITSGDTDESTSGTPPATNITGGITVQIQTTKNDYSFNSKVTVLPIPLSKQDRSSSTAYARAIDLKMINEAISVQGFLIEESDSRAIDKRNNLVTLGKTGGGLTVVWGQGNYQTLWKAGVIPYGVFIQKMMFTETAGSLIDIVGYTGDPPPERSMAIQITLVRGKDM